MRCRDVYLRIEKLPVYSPVAPDGGEHGRYGGGRVLCAGGIDPTHPVERDQRQMEVYSPAYLYSGPLMLFLVSGSGVPSEAAFVRIG